MILFYQTDDDDDFVPPHSNSHHFREHPGKDYLRPQRETSDDSINYLLTVWFIILLWLLRAAPLLARDHALQVLQVDDLTNHVVLLK